MEEMSKEPYDPFLEEMRRQSKLEELPDTITGLLLLMAAFVIGVLGVLIVSGFCHLALEKISKGQS